MNLKVEEILILIVAFIIGYFVSNMISGSSLGSGSIVKAVGGKHVSGDCDIWNNGEDNECSTHTDFDRGGISSTSWKCNKLPYNSYENWGICDSYCKTPEACKK